ncbi:MAG: tagatose-bisphosphate aldolase subunit KbaZ [Acidimicrobiia bacterium]|nr:MAG: tagatose-bisphosphate aldolase subunit KbaZ [Acidimicrobiia bacterium]
MVKDPLDALVNAQLRGEALGITSVCSANPTVLEATVAHGARGDHVVLIEATCNQVNQDGGYTGMTAGDFRSWVESMARGARLPFERLVLGGDHLGPNPWRAESAETAMEKAEVLVRSFAAAGYMKIHLDTSMKLGDDDPSVPLPPSIIASRAAALAAAAEDEIANVDVEIKPRYVIGTEVPVPGGAEAGQDHIVITTAEDVAQTIELHRVAFSEAALDDAWGRVVAVVTQPGVEFGDEVIDEYDGRAAVHLSRFIEQQGSLILEAHSTDYQTPDALREMVRDHFAVLKVGPALTFAYREAVFALSFIEDEMFNTRASGVRHVIEQVMLENPATWVQYYSGNDADLAFARKYSFSDRVRYVLPDERIAVALDQMKANLASIDIPRPLLSQFTPNQYRKIRTGSIASDPEAILIDSVTDVLDEYLYATTP